MLYSEQDLEDYVTRWGEVFVVLDSGVQYEIHGTDSYEVDSNDVVTVEGLHDGEYLIVSFPLMVVEHVYTHREV